LHVAGTDVVDDGIAVDVLAPFIGGNAVAAFADDEGQFGFVVGLGGVFGEEDGVAGADDGGGQLEKDDGRGGDGLVGFVGVLTVVEANGEDARRVGERSAETDLAELEGSGGPVLSRLRESGSDDL